MAEPDRRSRHACARIKFGSSTVGLSAWHRLGVRESPPTWLGIKTWDAYVARGCLANASAPVVLSGLISKVMDER